MLEGKVLNERYEIIKLIGGGGMANVYLGNDTILEREVAIKVLRLEYANDQEFITRFHREAQAATSLSHPNIVSIYDVGEEDQIYYMVMEYVDGMTLKQYIQLHAPIEVEEVIDIMTQITSAIAQAHENGLIHRDIKPQNILINPYGQVKVTDFGIAVALSATALTQTNSVLGSVHYLSPEQARGGKANRKSDIYSLGILLFELLTGQLPFSGQSAVSIALKHLQSETPSIREFNPRVPQSVENIVLKSTTKDPFHRYQTVYEMEEQLIHSLDPDKINETKFQPPESDDTITKAVPIIKEGDQLVGQKTDDEATLVSTPTDNVEQTGAPKEKKKNKRKKTFVWVTSLFVVLFGAILIALFVLPGLFQPKDVQVPDVAGLSYEDAEQQLTEMKLTVVKEETSDEDVENNHVIETSPAANKQIKEGEEVTIYVSTGPETFEMDDYVGNDYDRIESILMDAGFKDVKFYEEFSDRPAGEIIAQYQPSAGSEVVPRETNVIFEVSKGPEQITLNRLVGLHVDEATSYIDDNELNAEIKEVHSEDAEVGIVLEQNPAANEKLEKGDTVALTVSKGPEPKQQVTHTESFTIPYTGQNDEESGEKTPQEISIYVEDMNNDITELYQEVKMITEDMSFDIDLTIAPDDDATYKVLRDDELIMEKTIQYEDVEGE
ncbi:Stk1 family PASTA domain-containing Ser/Thr kinase [Gracilibacillus caseinilyticus]|uniref:non-specific serine/threonine protein kinase n=1 Tax=Gracilibacillus caseinilyticus TaxID=2932256 RepID=A0ABY4EU25_9BACI|nr:Stk1 family PASTA domain-containing Ser/Thr kinase [Gracilibacillus caseinilyticus]UOQ47920.1 Stk1 family PASTA domain-containing Ser/Thr kinase [Gracilibacillus caseinilyticus]